MTLIRELAGFVAGTSFGDLPADVVDAAKVRALDTIGGAIWAWHEGDAGRLISLADEFGGIIEVRKEPG